MGPRDQRMNFVLSEMVGFRNFNQRSINVVYQYSKSFCWYVENEQYDGEFRRKKCLPFQ